MASKLVPMTKDGQTIKVNPLCVEDHEGLGWKKVEAKKKAEPKADAKAEAEKAEK